MPDSKFSEPRQWPHRVFIFGSEDGQRPEGVTVRSFRDIYTRDAFAKGWQPKNGQTAIAVTVDFLIDGGDEPRKR